MDIRLDCQCPNFRTQPTMRLHRELTRSFFQLISITYSGLATAYVAAGGGRHPYYLGLPQFSKAVRLAVISNVPGIISVAVPKLAVACLLVRLLNPPISHKIFLYALTTSCILTQSLCAIFLWVQCKPAAGLWNPTLNPVCWNENILIDFSIFAGGEFRIRVWEETLTDYGSIFRIHRFVPRALSGLGSF